MAQATWKGVPVMVASAKHVILLFVDVSRKEALRFRFRKAYCSAWNSWFFSLKKAAALFIPELRWLGKFEPAEQVAAGAARQDDSARGHHRNGARDSPRRWLRGALRGGDWPEAAPGEI